MVGNPETIAEVALRPTYHRFQFRCGAPKAPYRLAISAGRYGHIVGFVTNINAGSIGLYHF